MLTGKAKSCMDMLILCQANDYDMYGYGDNTYEQFKDFIESFEGATTIQKWSTIEDELLSEVQNALLS